MKIIFSESKPSHGQYTYPYAIWVYPEENDTPADLYNAGFLPSAEDLSRFYMCRQVRVVLKGFELSSENRRVARKNQHINFKFMPRKDFDYNDEWKNFCLTYADEIWGKGVMPPQRLDNLFQQPITSHLLIFNDTHTNQPVGLVNLFIDQNKMAHYYYAFYDTHYFKNNLGTFIMLSAVKYFAENNFEYIYIGTCYDKKALYKTQFKNVEFFNGFKWSNNLKELKYLINQDKFNKHLLESEFVDEFYNQKEIEKYAKHLEKN